MSAAAKQGFALSPEQDAALAAILAWWRETKGKPGLFKLAGYAGTGKTTLMGEVVKELRDSDKDLTIAFATFTGKASTVLSGKVELGSDDYCGTIHGLIYTPIVVDGHVKGWRRKDDLGDVRLILIDEASMVNEEIFRDIAQYGLPILAVGDHGQLPPVNGTFNLMGSPDFRLETIHRQAEGNPIVKLSMDARTHGGRVHAGTYGPGVRKVVVPELSKAVRDHFDKDAVYLCAFNGTRVFVNKLFREILGIRSAAPIKGERLICLRNNREEGIYNGMTGIITKIEQKGKDQYAVELDMDGGGRFEGVCSRNQFGQANTPQNWNVRRLGNLFDWAYCMTVHKAQGSEAEKVVLIEQRMPQAEDHLFAKWLYTGITRARKELLIIKVGQ